MRVKLKAAKLANKKEEQRETKQREAGWEFVERGGSKLNGLRKLFKTTRKMGENDGNSSISFSAVYHKNGIIRRKRVVTKFRLLWTINATTFIKRR